MNSRGNGSGVSPGCGNSATRSGVLLLPRYDYDVTLVSDVHVHEVYCAGRILENEVGPKRTFARAPGFRYRRAGPLGLCDPGVEEEGYGYYCEEEKGQRDEKASVLHWWLLVTVPGNEESEMIVEREPVSIDAGGLGGSQLEGPEEVHRSPAWRA
jgi:hypothetical protein